jgi:hypothetical protein
MNSDPKNKAQDYLEANQLSVYFEDVISSLLESGIFKIPPANFTRTRRPNLIHLGLFQKVQNRLKHHQSKLRVRILHEPQSNRVCAASGQIHGFYRLFQFV